MTLCTEVFKVWQTVQTDRLQFLYGDLAVAILIKQLQYGVDNVICLLRVLNLVLQVVTRSISTLVRSDMRTHLGLLLRIDMMDTVYGFDLFPVPKAVTNVPVRVCTKF